MIRKVSGIFIVAAFFSMLFWEIYVEFFATRIALSYIYLYHLDKVFHFIGGAFVAALLFYFLKEKRFIFVAIAILAVSGIWELWEFLFDSKTILFVQKSKDLWLRDTVFDTLFGFMGALAYYLITRQSND